MLVHTFKPCTSLCYDSYSYGNKGGGEVPKWPYRGRLEIDLRATSPHVGSNPTLSAIIRLYETKPYGEMPERPKGHDWKSCVPSKGVPWVRIPLSPPRVSFAVAGFSGRGNAVNPVRSGRKQR